MPFIGAPVSQIGTGTFSQQNCVVTCLKKLMECSSLGYWNPSVAHLRAESDDSSGGITYDTALATSSRVTGGEVVLSRLYWTDQSILDDLLDAPRVVTISILCSVTRYTPFRTGTFTGGHSVVLADKRFVTLSDGTRQKQGLIMDPGHTDAAWVWWPWSLILRATAARAGAGKVHVMYTRDLGGVSRKAHAKGSIRSATKVIDKPSNVVGSFASGESVGVIATVSGSPYTLEGKTLTAWNKTGANRFAVAKIR